MIITEIIEIDGNQFRKTYSDDNRYVIRDGINYDEAIDPLDSFRTYIEGKKKEIDQNIEIKEYAEAGKILLGEENINKEIIE